MRGLTKVFYFFVFVLIAWLVFYDGIWWEEYELNKRGAGRETQLFGNIINISEDYFYLHTASSDVRIESFGMPPVRRARYGETVVHGIFREGGITEGLDYHNYDYNYVLYILSFIAFIIFLIIFFKEWKITFGRRYLFDNKYPFPPHNCRTKSERPTPTLKMGDE